MWQALFFYVSFLTYELRKKKKRKNKKKKTKDRAGQLLCYLLCILHSVSEGGIEPGLVGLMLLVNAK